MKDTYTHITLSVYIGDNKPIISHLPVDAFNSSKSGVLTLLQLDPKSIVTISKPHEGTKIEYKCKID